MNVSRLLHIIWLVWDRLICDLRCGPTLVRALKANALVRPNYYTFLDEEGLRRRIRGDTLFVLGSGASLATLSDETLAEMSHNSTMSLNYTLLQSFIPADFHVVRELGVTNVTVVNVGPADLEMFGNLIAANPCYKDTVFLAQRGYRAWSPNLLIGSYCLPKGTKIFRFRNSIIPGFRAMGRKLSAITHGASTITDCINIAFLLGFKEIVLCGVDLYDRRYFWHVPGTPFIPLHGVTDAQVGEYGGKGDTGAPHRTGERLLGQMAAWRAELEAAGVILSVQNPKSLLAEVLPVHVGNMTA